MTRHLAALAALLTLAALSACSDPTQKHDYGCTATSFGSATGACVQFHVTEVEGNAAEVACKDKGGTWAYHACDGAGVVPGYCQVDSAGDYSLSGTPAKVFFYDPLNVTAAAAACTSGGGRWIPAAD